MAVKVGSILIQLGMDQARFQAGVKSARSTAAKFGREVQRDFKKLRSSVNNTGRAFGRMAVAVAAVAAPAALGAITASSFRSADALAKFADRIGTSTEELRGLQMAAEETAGVGASQLNQAMQRMTRRVAEAANGAGEAKDVIADLGLDARQLAQQDPALTFRQISDAIQGVEDPAQQLRIAFKLFDSEGAALVNTLRVGSAGLEEYKRQAELLGIAISRIDAAKIEAANDAVGRAKSVFEGLGNTVAVQVAPFVEALAQSFVDSAVEAGGFSDVTARVFNKFQQAIGFVADAGRGLQVVFVGWQAGVAGAVNLIVSALASLVGALNSVFQAVVRQVQALNDALPDWLRPDGLQATVDRLRQVNLAAPFEEAARNTEAAFDGAMMRLNELLTAPLPSAGIEQWAEAVQVEARKAAEAVAAAAGGVPPAEEGGEEGAQDAASRADNLRQTIASSLVTGAKEGADGMLSTFAQGLEQMATEFLQSQIMNLLKNLPIGGAGGGGGLFGSIGGLFGFAQGGSFRVGGSGGTDSQLVAFRASPDETVTVRRPDQMGGGGFAPVYNITLNGGAGPQDRALLMAELERRDRRLKADIADRLVRRRF